MKHITSLCLLILLSVQFVSAQDIGFKKISDTETTIVIQPIRIAKKWQPTIEYSLMCTQDNNQTNSTPAAQYSVLLSVHSAINDLVIEKGAKLLLRIGDGETMVLENQSGIGYSIYNRLGYYSFVLQSSYLSKESCYSYNIKYDLSAEDLDRIIKYGISSLRVQTSANNINCEHTPEKTEEIKEYFSKAKDAIEISLNPRLTF